MDKRWHLAKVDESVVASLQQELNISKQLCKILVSRGVNTFDEAKQFFRPSLNHLHDPFLMKGMDLAVARIIKAIDEKEQIMLYGDYDVDGTTSVAVVCHFLQHYLPNTIRYVPNRFTEGYGVSEQGMQFAVDQKVNLLITLDCGIKSHAHVEKAKTAGIDVIICDHHLPEDTVPDALAILNPKQSDCAYPFKELCGCGIGFKLICALEDTIENKQDKCFAHLDLVASAIAADIVPIVDENRTLAYFGLEKANANPCEAIKALKVASSLLTNFTITDLVFLVAPRVNAAGRINHASKAVDLFMATEPDVAAQLAQELNIDNAERKEIDTNITAEAIALLQEQTVDDKSTVLFNRNWHKGVVGIVASRLIENKYQPTIVLTESNGKVTGSARSIPGFNLFDGLGACAEYLDTYGGHYFAAGLTLKEENLDAFAKKFNATVKATLKEEDFLPTINIDAEILLSDITDSFYNVLLQYAPHGPQNMRPIFCVRGVSNYQGNCRIVKEKHVKFSLLQNDATINGIGFGLANKFDITQQSQFDVCFHLEPNVWNGRTSLEIRVLDIKPHNT
jgi:single-stranded-DNA-specific exonuclease